MVKTISNSMSEGPKIDDKATRNRAKNGVAEKRPRNGARRDLFWPKCSPRVLPEVYKGLRGVQNETGNG